MGRLDGTVAEVLFDPKQVDPRLRNWESDGYVFTWNLPVLVADVARHENVGTQFDFLARHAECCSHLEREFAVLGRAHAESQQLHVACVRRPESENS